MAEAASRNFIINFGPQHPAAHGVLRLVPEQALDVGALTPPLWALRNAKNWWASTSVPRVPGCTPIIFASAACQDLPSKLIDDIWNFCDPFLKVCDDLEVLLTENRIFKQRNVDIGVIKLDGAWAWGFPGVMVRGSGAVWDPRKAQPYECYSELEFDIPIGKHGDCYDRYVVRMEEMRQAVRIMKQCLERLRSAEGQQLNE
jgi:NADH-quinone oxidoreductase subunit D